MELREYFPMWEKLTSMQQARLLAVSYQQKFRKGQIVHNGLTDREKLARL